jgi:uncharacterized protein YodC (DUF2158 family)
METFRKRLRWFGTPCLLFSLSTALAEGNVNTLAPAPLPTISPAGQLEPPVADPYQQLSTQIVKNAKAQTGPKLMAGKDSYDAPTVWCAWFEGTIQKNATFPPEALKHA